jgi:hypothetical protein
MKHSNCGKVIALVVVTTVFSSMSIPPASAATDPVITWMESSLVPSTSYPEISIASYNGEAFNLPNVTVSGSCSIKKWLITTKKSGFCTVKITLRAKGNFKAKTAIKKFAIKPADSVSTDLPTTFTNRTTANGLGSDIVNGVYVDGQNVYAATEGGLSISSDGGMTFSNRTMANGLGSKNVIRVIANGSNVYAATQGGLSISSDGGNTFTNRTTANGLGNNYVSSLAVVGSTVFAVTSLGLSISTDGGTTFIYRPAIDDRGFSSANDLYVDGSKIYLSSSRGVSISTDEGKTFNKPKSESGLGNAETSSTNGLFAVGERLYAATRRGLSVSLDGGQTFRRQWIAVNIGLGCDHINDVFVSGKTIYAATGDGDCHLGGVGGLSMSTNGGRTYTNLTTANGLGNNMVNEVQVVGSKVYLATGLTGKRCVNSCGGLSISN